MRGIKIVFGAKGRSDGLRGGWRGNGSDGFGVGGPPIPPEERINAWSAARGSDHREDPATRKEPANTRKLSNSVAGSSGDQEPTRRTAGRDEGLWREHGRRGHDGRRVWRRRPDDESQPREHERRMKHLKVAVDNLREAGMPEMADRLWQQGQAILEGRPMGGRMMSTPPARARHARDGPGSTPWERRECLPHAPGMPGQPPPGTPMMPGMALPPGASDGPGTGGTADGHAARDGRRDDAPRRSIAPRPGDLPGAVTAVAGADPGAPAPWRSCASN